MINCTLHQQELEQNPPRTAMGQVLFSVHGYWLTILEILKVRRLLMKSCGDI